MSTPLDNWKEEIQSAFLYREVAKIEKHQPYKKLFRDLADAAESQAVIWAEKIREQGEAIPDRYHPPLRTSIVVWLVRRLGPKPIRPILAAMKVRGLSVYTATGLHLGHPLPTSIEEVGHRHKGVDSGGNLRAAVFGVNDGLVSNTCLILGIAAATHDTQIIILSGIAGILAGAFSMASGEYVSVRSQRELFEYQIGLERDELAEYPEEEAEELALIYNARGLDMEQAREIAKGLMEDPENALDILAREELGLNPSELGSPWGAALSSFLAFAVGSLVPLLPFLYGDANSATLMAAVFSITCLFLVGSTLSLYTGKSALWSGVRMVGIGVLAGSITYTVGYLLGISIS